MCLLPSTITFESIDVPGVDFLAVTASSDFEDYAGNMRSADSEKDVGFTLIDGVFNTYDFPGSQGTYFYALGNDGTAAGHYQDSDGLYHGVILENGELRQYHFPGAVQTEIYGLSDATEALTGSYIDASGVRRGFSGDTIVERPGALATYADFCELDRPYRGQLTWILKVYIMHTCVVQWADFYLLTCQTQQIWNTFFCTVSTMQGLSLVEPKRWAMSHAPMSAAPSTYKNCTFRAALARKAGISIRTALSSDTMTQQMDADTGLLPDSLPRQ